MFGDDVELIATLRRNPFPIHMKWKGRMFATERGAYFRFGNTSSSCDQYKEAEGCVHSATVVKPISGSATVGEEGECRYVDIRMDKWLEVKPRRFYRHSNLERGAMIIVLHEFVWIDPETDLSSPPARKPLAVNYDPRLAALKSRVSDIRNVRQLLSRNAILR